MDGFMQLVKDMREAQKEYFKLRPKIRLLDSAFPTNFKRWIELNEHLETLERRVDEEIAAAERQDFANGTDCVRMANGQILRQGNLFEDQ